MTTTLPAVSFRPTPAQRRLLDYIHEHPSFKTVHELCAAAGIGRTAYYAWCKSPDFRLWLASSWSARLLMDGTVLLNIARVGATRSFSYWKALAELTFDPKGLGLLAKWQQNVAQANSEAFEPAESDPPPSVPAVPAAPTVRPNSEPNQPLAAQNRTNQPAAFVPRPNQAAKHLQRHLHPYPKTRTTPTVDRRGPQRHRARRPA